MLFVGLTGNYGMGKSTILTMFKKLGAIIIDTDRIVDSLLKETDVLKNIRGLLGDTVFCKNGSLNKKKVADLVFTNEALRHSLENILHPLVFERIDLILDKTNSKDKIIIIEAPLLYERGYKDRFNRTVTVHTKEETALSRLKNDGIKKEDAILRLKSQLPVEEKVKQSDFVIDNNGTTEETKLQVETIYKKLLNEVTIGNNQRS